MRAMLVPSGAILAASGGLTLAALIWEPTKAPIPTDFEFAPIDSSGLSTDRDAPVTDNGVIIARPLFSPTRRPPPPTTPEKAVESPDSAPAIPSFDQEPDAEVAAAPRFKLLGTGSGSNTAAALIALEDNAVSEWVTEGTVLSGWRVSSIGQEQVRLVREPGNGEELILSLYPDRK